GVGGGAEGGMRGRVGSRGLGDGYKGQALKKQNQALIDFGFEELLKYIKDKNLKTYENFLSQSKILFFNFDEKFHFFEFAKF
ncbi:hypothetical protein ACISJP_06275, partial [Campylobacter coli]